MPNRVAPLLAFGVWLMATAVYAQSQPASQPAGGTVVTPIPSIVAPGPKFVAPAPKAPPPSIVSPVTVPGAPGPVAVQKQTRDFVLSFAAMSPAIDQMARWHAAICISVAGLAPDQAARVASRIQEVAQGVGLPTLPPGCRANIEVVFTDQPQAFMDQVAKTREEILGYYHRREKASLKTVTRPIQAWYTTATDSGVVGGNAGLAFADITTEAGTGGAPTDVTFTFQPKVEVADDPDNPVPSGCSDSPQFTHCLLSKLSNVLIVIDPSRLKDKTLGPITDYLSLLALSQVRSLDGCAALPSVIDLLGKPCADRRAPDGLTAADAAYLTSLYASDLEASKSQEQDEISVRMSSMLTRPR